MRVAILLVLALVAVSAFQAEDEADRPRRQRGGGGASSYPQRGTNDAGARLVKPTVAGSRTRFHNSKPLVIVQRCDPRAYPSAEAHARACAKPAGPVPMLPNKLPVSAAPKRLRPAVPKWLRPAAPKRLRPAIKLPSVAPAVFNAPVISAKARATPARRPTLQSSRAAAAAARPVLKASAGGNPGSCLSAFNPTTLVNKANQYQVNYAARKTQYNQARRQFGFSVSFADCSSFVFSVMDAAGYGCLFNNARTTATMRPLEQARGGFHSTPKAGDLAMWTSHTGIVVGTAPGRVTMVAMGVHGCRNTGSIPLAKLPGWGSGTFLGYWTPRA